jgi:hypothetical protein
LSIERVEDAARGDEPSGNALAQFVLLPSDADGDETLRAAGLRARLPEQTGCNATSAAEGASEQPPRDSSSFEVLELLEAGDVSLRANGTVTHLALNLFPGSGSASGVLYTTPDQSASPLPPNALYTVDVTGSDAIPSLSIEGHSPASLSGVTLSGVPIDEAVAVTSGEPLDMTWTEGASGDRVYVEVADTGTSLLCAFSDRDGSGTIPGHLTALLAPGGSSHLSMRRIRESTGAQEAPNSPGRILETSMRFDFELTAALRIE